MGLFASTELAIDFLYGIAHMKRRMDSHKMLYEFTTGVEKGWYDEEETYLCHEKNIKEG